MEFAMGFFGALVCLGVFGLGAATGWRVCARTRAASLPPHDAPNDCDAFRRLQNYSVADAYGQTQQEG